MQMYHIPQPHTQAHEAPAVIPEPVFDGCLMMLDAAPDLVITQGADAAYRFCAEKRPAARHAIACLEPDTVTTLARTCIAVGDVISLVCTNDCDIVPGSQHTVTEVAADGLSFKVEPALPVVGKECYTSGPIPLIGCLDMPPPVDPPSFLILQSAWTLHGVLSYQVSDGQIRQMGVQTQAGSRYVRTTATCKVSAGDHVTIQSAGIIDADVISVSQVVEKGLNVDILELSQPATTTGCFAAYAADGILLTFGVRQDGACIIAEIPASQTKLLRARPGTEVPEGCDPRTFLGYYAIFGSHVALIDGVPKVFTKELASGCATLRLTAAGNVRLQTLGPA